MIYTRKNTADRALLLYYRRESGFSNAWEDREKMSYKLFISSKNIEGKPATATLRSKQLKGNN
jgi:hypothetical protein